MSAYGTTPNKDSTITRVRTRTRNSLGNATFRFFFRVSCVSVGAESFPGPAHTLNASAFTTVCIGIGRALIVRISWICVPQCPAESVTAVLMCPGNELFAILHVYETMFTILGNEGVWFVYLCSFVILPA